jgi:hypothetical protein
MGRRGGRGGLRLEAELRAEERMRIGLSAED